MSQTTITTMNCDRCGVKIDRLIFWLQLKFEPSGALIDLCKECDSSLHSWLQEVVERKRREEALRRDDR